jgi:hypothetical protein
VSKERARRRAEREREAAIMAAAKAAEAERKERRDARVHALTGWLPERRRRPTGILAERRRTQTRLLVLVVVVLNVLVWLATGDWATRAFALLLSVLVAPLVHILMTKN